MNRDLLWSWGLHRILDSREKRKDNQGAWLEKPGVQKGETKRQRKGILRDEGQWEILGCPGQPCSLYPCSPELRPLSCSRPPDSRLRSPSCWPRSQMSPGKAS